MRIRGSLVAVTIGDEEHELHEQGCAELLERLKGGEHWRSCSWS
jgi:hypothetical protein